MAEQSAIIDGATNVSRSRESPPSKSSKLSLARSRKCPGKRLSARIGTSKSFARRIAWERLRRSNDSADFLNDSADCLNASADCLNASADFLNASADCLNASADFLNGSADFLNDSADFLNDSMEHAVQHASKYVEMLATFPHELKYFQV